MIASSVLVAEDDIFIRRVTETTLKRAGFEVRSVVDGLEALEVLAERLFDVVLLDVMMPRMNGIDLCRAIKAEPRFARIVVIVLSATIDVAETNAARAAGADGFIPKPFDALALGGQIREICARF